MLFAESHARVPYIVVLDYKVMYSARVRVGFVCQKVFNRVVAMFDHVSEETYIVKVYGIVMITSVSNGITL